MGETMFRVVGQTAGAVATSGDPLVWITLRDSLELQYRLAPPAASWPPVPPRRRSIW